MIKTMTLLVNLAFMIFPLNAISHSYNAVELENPISERKVLLIKDHHKLGSARENLAELDLVVDLIARLDEEQKKTNVMFESMWLFGKTVNAESVISALNDVSHVNLPKGSMVLPFDATKLMAIERGSTSYIDMALPIRLAKENLLKSGEVTARSIDPRLPIVKLHRILKGEVGNKLSVKLSEVWDILDRSKAEIEAIYQLGENCDFLVLTEEFWKMIEKLSQEQILFEKFLSVIPRDDSRTKQVLTKRNVKKILKGRINDLITLTDMEFAPLPAHSWAVDSFGALNLLNPDGPENTIVLAGGMHQEFFQSLLTRAGYVVKSKKGVEASAIVGEKPSSSDLLGLMATQWIKLDPSVASDTRSLFGTAFNLSKREFCPQLLSHTCANTGCSKDASSQCGGCHEVFYCKRECQKEHWAIHKRQCKKAESRK